MRRHLGVLMALVALVLDYGCPQTQVDSWSISVDLDGKPTTLEFDQDVDVRARAEQFLLEQNLQAIPGADELADQLAREMENTMVYAVEQGGKAGTFSWETSVPDERAALQLVVVDDFMAQPAALRAFGRAQRFAYKGNHPGMRTASFANLPEFRPVRRRVEALVGERLPYWFAAFQLSRANDTDNGIHRDYPTYKYSAVLYLTPGAPCRFGTSTYRHLSTGLVSYPDEGAAWRRNTTVEALSDELQNDASEDKYEEMDRVGNRYNRLIVFNSRVNHRSSGRGGFGRAVDGNDGRLVMIMFFNTEDPRGQENSILWHDEVW